MSPWRVVNIWSRVLVIPAPSGLPATPTPTRNSRASGSWLQAQHCCSGCVTLVKSPNLSEPRTIHPRAGVEMDPGPQHVLGGAMPTILAPPLDPKVREESGLGAHSFLPSTWQLITSACYLDLLSRGRACQPLKAILGGAGPGAPLTAKTGGGPRFLPLISRSVVHHSTRIPVPPSARGC